MVPYFKIDEKLLALSHKAEELARAGFGKIEENQRYNQQKMLAA